MIKKVLKKIKKRYIILSNKNMIIDKFKFKIYKFNYLGQNIRISENIFLGNSKNIRIEDDVFIGNQAYIDAVAKISIKKGSMIGPRFTCISGNHYYDSKDLKAIPYDNRILLQPISIGENVWIASCVSILPGITIGEGAVIGMGVTVYKDVPAYSIVVGNPMKIIKYRDKDIYNKLKNEEKIYNKLYSGKNFKYIERK